MRRRFWPWTIAFVALIGGCASRPAADDPCCTGAERYPPALVAVLEPVAPIVGQAIALVKWRKGFLNQFPEAQEAVLRELRPLDLVFVSSKGGLAGNTIPGLFGHVATYLGTERQLREAGLWSAVDSTKHRDAIQSGQSFLEADSRGIHFSSSEFALNVDRVLVVRPRLASKLSAKNALRTYLSFVGTPYDFRFDVDDGECVFCTELVYLAMPELRLRTDKVYGRNLIFPDEVARSALRGHPQLRPRLYVIGRRDGWSVAPAATALTDIRAEWAH
jgi:hypothetical protein